MKSFLLIPSVILKNIILCFLLMPTARALADSNSFIPPAGKTLLIVGQDRDTIAKYVKATSNVPGGTMLYTSLEKLEGLAGPTEYGSGPEDGNALLKSYPNSVVQVGLYIVNELDEIINGQYDAHLKILAQWIKKANRPIYLRIGYEFDNPDNLYEPEKYKQAYHYIVDFLRHERVQNAVYVWHSYCWIRKSGDAWLDWYPGDDDVDWFGASVFAAPHQPSMVSDFVKLSRQHHKPFMICESTPWGMYTSRGKIDFLKHVFHFIKEENIEAFCYIDSNWDIMPMYKGQHIGDARIEKYPEIKKLWLKEIKNDRYLKSSPGLYQSLGMQSSS